MTQTTELKIKQRQKHCKACAALSRELDSERTAREKAENMAMAFEALSRELINVIISEDMAAEVMIL